MNGTSNERFSPTYKFNKGTNGTSILQCRLLYAIGGNNVSSFIDVRQDHWAYIAIETMKQEGIMAGYGDGRFGSTIRLQEHKWRQLFTG